jgi:hypothetical protein
MQQSMFCPQRMIFFFQSNLLCLRPYLLEVKMSCELYMSFDKSHLLCMENFLGDMES